MTGQRNEWAGKRSCSVYADGMLAIMPLKIRVRHAFIGSGRGAGFTGLPYRAFVTFACQQKVSTKAGDD